MRYAVTRDDKTKLKENRNKCYLRWFGQMSQKTRYNSRTTYWNATRETGFNGNIEWNNVW